MENGTSGSNGKRRLRKILYVYIAFMLALILCSKTIYNYSLPRVTVIMPKAGRLNKELEARGVIEFAETIDICADGTGRIEEMLIKKGDIVTAGTPVARLAAPDASAAWKSELALNRIYNQLASKNLSKSDIESKLERLSADPAVLLPYENALTDAQAAFDKAQADYNEAVEVYVPSQAAADALREWNRRKSELQGAVNDLERVNSDGGEDFDGYEYLLEISAAEINLARSQDDLEKAREDLNASQNSRDNFDVYEYEKTVDSALTAYQQSQKEYETAVLHLNNTENYYNGLLIAGDNAEATAKAEQERNSAVTALQAAEAKMSKDSAAYTAATEDMSYAQSKFQSESADARAQAVEAAKNTVKQAENAAADAERALDIAKESLERAESEFYEKQAENKEDAKSAAEQKVKDTQALAEDAEYVYNNASANAEKENEENLKASENKLTDAQKALDRAEKNLEAAAANQLKDIEDQSKDYKLQLNRLELEIELANIDLSEAQLSERQAAEIKSGYGGIIVSVDKKAGQYASPGERIAVAGVAGSEFICEIKVPESEARFIETGDAALVSQSGSAEQTEANVTNVNLEGDILNITLALESEALSGGEYVSVKFTKQSMEYETIVPAEAVISGPTSSYVWVVEQKQGALGIEYYTRRVNVLTADKNGFHTAISAGLDNFRPVVVSYDKEPAVNGRVRRLGE